MSLYSLRTAPRDPSNNKVPLIGLEDYSIPMEHPNNDEEHYSNMKKILKEKRIEKQKQSWGKNSPTKDAWMRSSSSSLKSSIHTKTSKKVQATTYYYDTNRSSTSRNNSNNNSSDTKKTNKNTDEIYLSSDDESEEGESDLKHKQMSKDTSKYISDKNMNGQHNEKLSKEVKELKQLIRELAEDNKSMKESVSDLTQMKRKAMVVEKLKAEKESISKEYEELKEKLKRNKQKKSKEEFLQASLLLNNSEDDLLLDYEKAAFDSGSNVKSTVKTFEPISGYKYSEEDSELVSSKSPTFNIRSNEERKSNIYRSKDYDSRFEIDNNQKNSLKAYSSSNSKFTISAQRLHEDLRKKALEEEYHLNKRFKAKSIPETTTQPLYEQLLISQELARQQAHESRMEELKKTENPFKGMVDREEERKGKAEHKRQLEAKRKKMEERKNTFRANAIPDKVATQSAVNTLTSTAPSGRKEKIQLRAMEMLSNSSLPPRMAMWEKSQRSASRSRESSKMSKTVVNDNQASAHKPNVKMNVPNFQKKHDSWNKRLREARLSKQGTITQEFSFLKSDTERGRKELDRKHKRDERKMRLESKLEAREKENNMKLKPKPAKKEPAMTKSTELRLRLTQEKMLKRKQEELMTRKEQEDQLNKSLATSRIITQTVAENEKRRQKKNPGYVSLDDIALRPDGTLGSKAKKKASTFMKKSSERAKYNQDRIEEALSKRPHLWDRHDIELEKEKAKRKALLKVAAAVLNGTNKKDWRTDKDRAQFFNEDEKDLLYDFEAEVNYDDNDKFNLSKRSVVTVEKYRTPSNSPTGKKGKRSGDSMSSSSSSSSTSSSSSSSSNSSDTSDSSSGSASKKKEGKSSTAESNSEEIDIDKCDTAYDEDDFED